jgi:site-specific DNA-methyltransferase (adenine-specific)
LAVNCIKIHGGLPDLVVLDPFLGIGHSGLAAKECGVRRFVGFEIDPEYLEVARTVLKVPLPAGSRPVHRRRAASGGTDGQVLFDLGE